MVRSYWIGPVFGALALAGFAQGQTNPSPPAAPERLVTVQEPGKPAQRCKVLKMWTEPDGTRAFQAQALDTGELMTLEDEGPAPSRPGLLARSGSMRVFHWGRGVSIPAGAPEPPPDAVVVGSPMTTEPPLAAAASAAPAPSHGKWPAAFTQAKAGGPPAAAAAPAPTQKKLEPLPAAPAVVIRPVQPLPAVVVAPKPQEPKAAPASPYGQITNASAEKPATPFEPSSGGSPYAMKPAAGTAAKTLAPGSPCPCWGAKTTWAPAMPVPGAKDTIIITKEGTFILPPGAPAPTPAAVAKVETTPAKPGDWRQSWGKVATPSVAAAPPKSDLPHAAPKADDPLKTPDKYTRLPKDGAFDGAKPAEKKAPLLASLALQQPVAAKPDAKDADKHTPPPPAPPAPVAPPPLTPPAPVAAAKPEAKPAVPLGMASVLAAASPELAPPAGPSQQAATGIKADEPNAFMEQPKAGAVASAPNAFSAPPLEPMPAADALAGNAFPSPRQAAPAYLPPAVAMRPTVPAAVLPAPAEMPVAYLVPADSRPVPGDDLESLAAALCTSVYPSQREWAAESLATMDWRHQPGVVEVLVERAKDDPAPTVRVECVRALGRMKADAPAAIEAVKALQADPDARVRQAAVEAHAAMTAAPGH